MVQGGFDGFYTYFAANDFSYGSSWKNWKSLSSFAKKNRLLFVPSVGPGTVLYIFYKSKISSLVIFALLLNYRVH